MGSKKKGGGDARQYHEETLAPGLRRSGYKPQRLHDQGKWLVKNFPTLATMSRERRSELAKKHNAERWARATPEDRRRAGLMMAAKRKPEHYAPGGRAAGGGIWNKMDTHERANYAARLLAERHAKRVERWKKNPPVVVHVRDPHDMKIDRTTLYGNPFRVNVFGREESIRSFEAFARSNPNMLKRIKKIIPGTRIACHCKPLACHGDVIVKLWLELRCGNGEEKAKAEERQVDDIGAGALG